MQFVNSPVTRINNALEIVRNMDKKPTKILINPGLIRQLSELCSWYTIKEQGEVVFEDNSFPVSFEGVPIYGDPNVKDIEVRYE